MQSVYDFKPKSIAGSDIDLSKYRGKKILLVNTASACGYTPQYKQLEELSEHYKDKLVVVGLPCNDFGAQEPGTEGEIAQFCEVNYGVTFPLTAKIKIKGDEPEPLYRYLTSKDLNGYADSEVQWNFQKYLVNENGELIGVFNSGVEPLSDELLNAIDK
jgi:glutathione peroxidase